MKLEAALSKIGAEVISEESLGEGTVRIMVRSGVAPAHVTAWRNSVTEFLLHSDEISKSEHAPWTVDLSRAYFVVGGAKVKYAWRLIITGDVGAATSSLGSAIVRGMGSSVELKSFPIVTPVTDGNAAKGRLKGAHPIGTADAIVAREFAR